MLKAVLFDFDQTVINSVEGFRSAEHWLQGELSDFLQLADWESFIAAYRAFRGKESADTPEQKAEQWKAFCRQQGKDPGEARLDEWRDGYWSIVEKGSTLFPETLSVLRKLKERFQLGLITNAYTLDGTGHRLDRFPELKSLFNAVVLCGNKDIPAKPHKEGFLRMLSSLGIPATAAIYIGDDPVNDIQGARGAGIFPVLLRHRDIRRNRALPESGELICLDSLEALSTIDPADSMVTIQRKLR